MNDIKDDFKNHPRAFLLIYDIGVLFLLLLIAILSAVNNPGLFSPLFDPSLNLLAKLPWGMEMFISIWFAMLGAVAVNLKGINDHRQESNKSFHKWDLWYFDRPVSGIVVGIMTYILLQVANLSSPPSLPTLA